MLSVPVDQMSLTVAKGCVSQPSGSVTEITIVMMAATKKIVVCCYVKF